MATIVTVHGTFAHAENGGVDSEDARQWWQQGSDFDRDLRELVDAAPGQAQGSGNVEVKPFEWSGDNSETARRAAGRRLYAELKALEAKGESYCVVGHSHGGSVMSWALLEGAARKQSLPGLKRWITVGTPFVSLRKQPLLIQRLDLMRKVVFIASLMLIGMFLFDIAVQLLAGSRSDALMWVRRRGPHWLMTAALMSVPVLLFYIALKWLDSGKLVHYRRRVRERARDTFGHRWLSLTHTDDEAVQGLAFLPGARLHFVERNFAVPAITMLSVIALPLIYLVLISSPALMVGLADLSRRHLYGEERLAAEMALREAIAARDAWRQEITRTPDDQGWHTSYRRPLSLQERRALRTAYLEKRKALFAEFTDLAKAERALRFKRRFFESRDGTPCDGGRLCGGGRDLRINSRLLLYLVTDEVSSAIVGDRTSIVDRQPLLPVLLPALLVPVVFGLLSLLIMLLVGWIAAILSALASRFLNSITNAEVKRAAFGNDTPGETAIGALDRPGWIERSPPRLPPELGDLVTSYSNGIANQSLAKFRRAIGQLASAEPKHTADSAITTYFTWKELVHASYFDVPEFRLLVAHAIASSRGFAPSPRLKSHPHFAMAAMWLDDIETAPGSLAGPADVPPSEADKGAVAAAIASTVREP